MKLSLPPSPQTKKILIKIVIFMSIFIIGFSIVLYFKGSKKTIKPKVKKNTSWLVDTIPAKLGLYSPYQQLYGKINNEKLTKILAHSSGEIKTVFVSSGELVKKGDDLVRLDDKDFLTTKEINQNKVTQTQLEIRQAQFDIDNAQKLLSYEKNLLEINKKRLDRAKRLAQQQNLSNTELEKTQENYLQRQANVTKQEKNQQDASIRLQRLRSRLKSEQAQLEQSSRSLQQSLTKSPVDGLITHVNIQLGSRIGTNNVLLEILPLHNLEMSAILVNDQLPIILDALQNKKQIHATINAFGSPLQALLTRIQGQASNGATVGIFTLKKPTLDLLQTLRPNTLLPILLELPKVPNSMKVPYSALYGSNKIYAVRKGHLHAIHVTLLGSTFGINKQENWALIQGADIQENDIISITNLPNATNKLPVIMNKPN